MVKKVLKTRIGYFLNHHERSFRTEIILVPALVISIKIFSDLFSGWPTIWQLLGTIAVSFLLYIGGMFIIILIGDKAWHKVIRKTNPIDSYQGVFYQNVGAEGRERAVSRIFYDEHREQYLYRGIAYSKNDNTKAAAAWEMTLSNSERIDGNIVLYFVGKSTISHELNEYNPKKFDSHVFAILYFYGRFKFNGGGFDFERRTGKDARDSFPIGGSRLDAEYLESQCISDTLLINSISISEEDRRRIFQYPV